MRFGKLSGAVVAGAAIATLAGCGGSSDQSSGSSTSSASQSTGTSNAAEPTPGSFSPSRELATTPAVIAALKSAGVNCVATAGAADACNIDGARAKRVDIFLGGSAQSANYLMLTSSMFRGAATPQAVYIVSGNGWTATCKALFKTDGDDAKAACSAVYKALGGSFYFVKSSSW